MINNLARIEGSGSRLLGQKRQGRRTQFQLTMSYPEISIHIFGA